MTGSTKKNLTKFSYSMQIVKMRVSRFRVESETCLRMSARVRSTFFNLDCHERNLFVVGSSCGSEEIEEYDEKKNFGKNHSKLEKMAQNKQNIPNIYNHFLKYITSDKTVMS
jgi:hypothetical protein